MQGFPWWWLYCSLCDALVDAISAGSNPLSDFPLSIRQTLQQASAAPFLASTLHRCATLCRPLPLHFRQADHNSWAADGMYVFGGYGSSGGRGNK